MITLQISKPRKNLRSERKKERVREHERESVCVCVCVRGGMGESDLARKFQA